MWQRVAAAGVEHMTAFNYRFVPAVRLARQMLEAGELGDVLHFRGRYLQEWGSTTADAWRFHKGEAGSGALGDLGAHVIDLARYLVGEIASVSASMRTFMEGREVDDAFESVVEFEGRALGTLEATRFAAGRKNAFSWEINGTKGSLAFDLERLNELQHSDGTSGFRTILVSEADHPFWEWWWPHGHMIGWETASSTRSTICSPRSPGTATSRRTERRSRTAIARPRFATRSSARASRVAARPSRTAERRGLPRRAHTGQLPGSGASWRLTAPAGTSCIAIVFATEPVSFRMRLTWPSPGSTNALCRAALFATTPRSDVGAGRQLPGEPVRVPAVRSDVVPRPSLDAALPCRVSSEPSALQCDGGFASSRPTSPRKPKKARTVRNCCAVSRRESDPRRVARSQWWARKAVNCTRASTR